MSVLSRPSNAFMVMQRRVQLQRAFLQLQRQSHSFWHTNDVESYGANAKKMQKESPKSAAFWTKFFFIVMVPCMLVSTYLGYKDFEEEYDHLKHRKQDDYIAYPYLGRREHSYGWDAKRSFMHNPYTNYIPGVGYEKLLSEELAKRHK